MEKKFLSRELHSMAYQKHKKFSSTWEQAWFDNSWTNPVSENGIKLKEMNEQMPGFLSLFLVFFANPTISMYAHHCISNTNMCFVSIGVVGCW